MSSESEAVGVSKRNVNCLSDPDRNTRRRAIAAITQSVKSVANDTSRLDSVIEQTQLLPPLLNLFHDSVEKNRDLAINLAKFILQHASAQIVQNVMPLLMVAVTKRIGPKPEEQTEELRLALLEMLRLLLTRFAAQLAAYIPELVSILQSGFADPFPDAKKLACTISIELASALPKEIETQCSPMIKSLVPCMAHQHSRVRSSAVASLEALLLCESSALGEIGPQLALLASDRTPLVREHVTKSLSRLLAAAPNRSAHTPRLLNLLLVSLSDELESIRTAALRGLESLGCNFPAAAVNEIVATTDLETAAAAASLADNVGRESQLSTKSSFGGYAADTAPDQGSAWVAQLEGTPFASAPASGAARLVASELNRLTPSACKEAGEWSADVRRRAVSSLLGVCWCAGHAVTFQLDSILSALVRVLDDEAEDVALLSRRCACVVGRTCDPSVYIAIVLAQLSVESSSNDSDDINSAAAGVGKRAMWLGLLGALLEGAPPTALSTHLDKILATVASPWFCVHVTMDSNDSLPAYAAAQSALCDFLSRLVSVAGHECATDRVRSLAYAALMRLAAVPSSAAKGFAVQRQAVVTVTALAEAAGMDTSDLHASELGPLFSSLVENDSFVNWDVDSSEWHLAQALLRQCDGKTAASVLLDSVPMLAALLDPKRDAPLRLTALSLLEHLLSDTDFAQSTDLADWAEHMYEGLLLPNLIWRAGKAAEQIRLAVYLCLSHLMHLENMSRDALALRVSTALPLFISGLDDDNVETRRLSCIVIKTLVQRIGAKCLSSDEVRLLYPELIKRLDDASDIVRLMACGACTSLLQVADYSPLYSESTNLDRTNLEYFVRGLLIHLDDPSCEIQQGVFDVLACACSVDGAVLGLELQSVRDRQRSVALVDRLLELTREDTKKSGVLV